MHEDQWEAATTGSDAKDAVRIARYVNKMASIAEECASDSHAWYRWIETYVYVIVYCGCDSRHYEDGIKRLNYLLNHPKAPSEWLESIREKYSNYSRCIT